MFLTERKLDRRITEIREYSYREVTALEEFAAREDRQGVVNPEVPTEFEGWNKIHTGDRWSGRDRYLWLHKEITIPESWKGKRAVGIFDFGNTGAGNNSGFEAMCYINEKPYQGVDVNHKEVFFPEELYGKTFRLTFRLWSGLEGGGVPREQEHRINRADLAYLDEKVDDFYYMGMLVLDTVQNLSDTDPVKFELRNALDEACLLIDWAYPGSGEFYESVHQADDLLNEKIDGMKKDSLVKVKCVGHTHIDMAWLWRLKHTHEKASRSFSTVLRMMEMFPEYIFLQTQPQLYEYIKEDFPEIYEEIKKRVKEGRWEVDGGMWVEADCNLTSGESLTRQILIGSKFIKDEFGKDVEYLWLPDVFGYSWALPQILKKSGIDMFMTTKISWNQYNRMPHDTFKWKGIDGSEVLTHFITTPEPWNEPGSWFYTYNGLLTAKTVKGVWDAYSEKEMNQELLIAYGYGDGGGGVNRDLLERRRRYASCIQRFSELIENVFSIRIIVISPLQAGLGKETEINSPVGQFGYIQTLVFHHSKLKRAVFDLPGGHPVRPAVPVCDGYHIDHLMQISHFFHKPGLFRHISPVHHNPPLFLSFPLVDLLLHLIDHLIDAGCLQGRENHYSFC